MSDLMPMPRGARRRRMLPELKPVYEEVQLAAKKADGAMALAGHIMEEVVELDRYRRHLGSDDATLHLLLAEIESTGVQQVKRIQRGLFNDWSA
ncbi:MAG: hypothetical protein LC808_00140 [Actinobacteria bacterium]|nr:hypothetical protein [Actinomycetota bacterium]